MRAMALVLATSLVSIPLRAQQPDPSIRATKVTDGVYLLAVNGGNAVLGIGEHGTLLIDDQFVPMADRSRRPSRR